MAFAFDDYVLDVEGFELRKGGEPVHMEPQVFDVLAYLVRNNDRMVPKDELIEHIWPEAYISEAALNSRIMSARRAVADSGREQRLIKTLHGRGYRFVGDVQVVAPEPAGAGRESTETRTEVAAVEGPQRRGERRLHGIDSPATSFIGRERELRRLDELLSRQGCRLVTLVGPGGVGKTRVAIEAARRQHDFGRDVVFVSLETTHDVAELPIAVGTALGLTMLREDTAAEVVEHLSSGRTLVVLDNFEQLSDAAPHFLSYVLEAAPDVQLLVTSRVVLGLREEWLVPIGGLALEEGGEMPEAVRLFRERQGQANALGEESGAEDEEAIREICRLVDGMPLALELAASLSRYLSCREIAEQLGRDIQVLSADLRNVPARHRSVPGLLEESCRLLDVNQVRALLALSVFEGTFSREGAAEVAEAPLPLLSALVDRSLVQPHGGRFGLHPLMRQFARERLGPAYGEMRQKHAEYCATFLERRQARLEGRLQVETTVEVDREFTNIVAAWRWSAENERFDLTGRMDHSLFLYIQYRSRYVEGYELARIGTAAIERATHEHPVELADLLVNSAWIAFRLGRFVEMFQSLQRASQLYREAEFDPEPGLGTDPRTAFAVMGLGTGHYSQSFEQAKEAADFARARGDGPGAALALSIAGIARLRMVDLRWERGEGERRARYVQRDGGEDAMGEARRLIREAAQILEDAGETWLRANVEIELGNQASAMGDAGAGIKHLELAYELRRAFNDPAGMAMALMYLGDQLIAVGELDRAEAVVEEAYQLASGVGYVAMVSEVERTMGSLAVRQGDLRRAWQMYCQSLRRAMSMGYANNALGVIRGMADVLIENGREDESLEFQAFVANHHSTPPWSKGVSRTKLEELAAKREPELVEHAVEQAREWKLEDVAAKLLEMEPPA